MKYHDLYRVKLYRVSIEGPAHRFSEHFSLWEAMSKDGDDIVPVSAPLLRLLERLRKDSGGAVHINSWYRSPAHNTAIGGARDSRHVRGLAADVVCDRWTPRRVASWAEGLDVGGIGVYRSFTHLDVGRYGRRWTG